MWEREPLGTPLNRVITALRNFFEENFDERVRLSKLRRQLIRLHIADPDVVDYQRFRGQVVAASAEEEDQAAADLLEAAIREIKGTQLEGSIPH